MFFFQLLLVLLNMLRIQVIHYFLLLLIIFYYSFRIYVFYVNLIISFHALLSTYVKLKKQLRLIIYINKYFIFFQELYHVNERGIYLERNIIKSRNNRILVDLGNQFDLNDFYQSTLSLKNQLNGYNDDEKEIPNRRNIIDSHVKNHKENRTLPNLNNVDKKTKNLIYEIRKELEETKKELDNKRDGELAIQLIQNKRITKKDENISALECKNFKQNKNEGNNLENEDDNFEGEYNKIISINNYKEFKTNRKFKKLLKKIFKTVMKSTAFLAIILTGGLIIPFMLLIMQDSFDETMNEWGLYGLHIKK
ncbi:fam-b protein [Plasmodium chabaudi chabaudi]|uniref:Fam-b protein n=1 Tax=Plasmodium chabaudi chabaudi TaxID=31271 RepID=A0A4V0K8I1_PLACU|nr:fam-b protein [Plasmodium chabaudi chabaudi]VTZ69450.1 fam-b protein [Plasmodium chabaudi chabaudi]|eukprot:XP_016654119.1 fam-b protein [Plasmodium chabaudi chabaudi]